MEYKLSEIFDLQMGKTPDRKNSNYWSGATEPWISIADLSKCDKYIDNTAECISEQAVEDSGIKIIPKNTVIMSFKLSIGKLAITPKEMYSNEAIMAFVDKGIAKIEPTYLYYLLMNKEWNEGTNKAVMGRTLNKATLSDIKIRIHKHEEQLDIINVLDKIQPIISDKKRQLEQLDILIKARFVEMFGDLMFNPNEWPVMKISDVSIFLKSGLSRKLSDDDIGIPVVRSGNIQKGNFLFNDIKFWYVDDPQGAKTADYVLEDGDILVNFINSTSQIGKTAIFKDAGRNCIYTTNIFRMKLADNCNKYYYNWFAMTDYYYRQLQNIIQPAVNQASFTTANFLKLNIPLPQLELQEQFAEFVQQVDKSKVV